MVKAHIRDDAAKAFREKQIKPFCKGQRVIPKSYLEFEKILEKWAGKTLEVIRSYGQGAFKRYVLKYPEPLEKENVVAIDVEEYLVDYVGD